MAKRIQKYYCLLHIPTGTMIKTIRFNKKIHGENFLDFLPVTTSKQFQDPETLYSIVWQSKEFRRRKYLYLLEEALYPDVYSDPYHQEDRGQYIQEHFREEFIVASYPIWDTDVKSSLESFELFRP